MQRTILVTGGSGFIGSHFCRQAIADGDSVYVISRDPAAAQKRLPQAVELCRALTDLPADKPIQVVVNLAGEPLVSGRWSKRRKALFRNSRIGTTEALCSYFQAQGYRPEILINGSAVGFYGPQSDRKLDESCAAKDSFSHQLCRDWEQSAKNFTKLGTRVCCLRTGLVLGRDEGALARMLPAFRFGLGGPIGNGRQWMSWIHVDDLVAMIFHCIARRDLTGAVNGTAPNPVRNKTFATALGRHLHRPALLPMPALPAKVLFGEMAKELLLTGQRVIPRKALETGFAFKFPELDGAFADLL